MIRIAITAARPRRPSGSTMASSTSKQPSYAPDELAIARAATDGIAQREMPESEAVLFAMGGGRGA
jgi:hypothetical protein